MIAAAITGASAAASLSGRVEGGMGFARPRALVPTSTFVKTNLRSVAASSSESSPSGGDDAVIAPRLGFIGAGSMAEAMARGFVEGGVTSFDRVSASNSGNKERAAMWRGLGADVCASNAEVLLKSDVVFLAVKPHILPGVLAEIGTDAEDRHLFVSVAAGVSTAFIEDAITQAGGPKSPRVVRVMPNTPCLVNAAASVACSGAFSTAADVDDVSTIMSAAGLCITLEERLMDAVVGVSGSGPAYVFQFIEAMADGGVAAGLPRADAQKLAAQTVLGAAKMVLETGDHPGLLKDKVCSPGGTTIRAVHALEKGGMRAAVIDAVLASAARSAELGSGK